MELKVTMEGQGIWWRGGREWLGVMTCSESLSMYVFIGFCKRGGGSFLLLPTRPSQPALPSPEGGGCAAGGGGVEEGREEGAEGAK